MEEGYPGELHVKATYSLTDRNELDMVFEAEGNEKPTIVNMTNHAYWNLSGNCKRSIDHHVTISYILFLFYRNYLLMLILILMVKIWYSFLFYFLFYRSLMILLFLLKIH